MSGGPSRRDFILIPLVSLATVIVMMLAAELTSRLTFVESGSETCGDITGLQGWRSKPNCVSRRKSAEGPMVENSYNDCGYRTPTPCGTRAPGVLRVALMGTSIAEGFKVRYEETFAARLTESLSRACGRPVEFQNMGLPSSMLDVYRRTDEALAMRPDVIMVVASAVDLKERMSRADIAGRDDPPAPPKPRPPAEAVPSQSLVARLSDLAVNSRALVAAQHFLFQDNATYVRLYMMHGEDADYLRPPLTQAWRERLDDLGVLLGGIAAKARSRGVPVLMIWSPTRIQAALLTGTTRPSDADPFVADRYFAEVAARSGAAFVDTLHAFQGQVAPERFFYAVDGHMNGEGSAVFAAAIEKRLAQGDIAPFSGCAFPSSGDGLRAASASK